MSEKSIWERTVELTIAAGERILAPIERFIGKRSLVGDATFFPTERFPWVGHIEENWEAIRDEAAALLDDHAALANFQDISSRMISRSPTTIAGRRSSLKGMASRRSWGWEMCPQHGCP